MYVKVLDAHRLPEARKPTSPIRAICAAWLRHVRRRVQMRAHQRPTPMGRTRQRPLVRRPPRVDATRAHLRHMLTHRGQPMNALIVRCVHHSQHGGEGPIATLGRFPVLWICDTCGHVEVGE